MRLLPLGGRVGACAWRPFACTGFLGGAFCPCLHATKPVGQANRVYSHARRGCRCTLQANIPAGPWLTQVTQQHHVWQY